MTSQDYIGVGAYYPMLLRNGSGLVSTGKPLIVQSMMRILGEQYGSRYFCRGFGSRKDEILFEPNDVVLMDLLKVFVIEALSKWEKRATVVGTNIWIEGDKINVDVDFRVIASNEVGSFTFPFYRRLRT